MPISHRLTIMKSLPIGVLVEDLHRRLLIFPLDDFRHLNLIDITKQGALTQDFPFREIERVHSACETIGTVSWVGEVFLRYPGVGEALVYGDAFVDLDGEHTVYEIKGWVADGVPVGGGIVEATHSYLLGQVVRVFFGPELVGEWWKAAETDVQDHA